MWVYLISGVRGIAYHSFLYGVLSGIGVVILPFLNISEKFRLFFTCSCLPVLARAMLFLSGTRIRVEGINYLRPLKESSYIMIANHVTTLDISVLTQGLNIPDMRYVYNGDSFRSVPVVGKLACRVFRGFGWFELNNIDVMSLRRISKRIRAQMDAGNKIRIMIFPEGGRSWEGEVNTFQPGAFYLAYLLGVPVVPVLLRGIYACHQPAQLRISAGQVGINVLPPLPAAQSRHKARLWTEQTRKKAERIYHRISSLNISS